MWFMACTLAFTPYMARRWWTAYRMGQPQP